jgi:hypothetical protein
MLFFCFCFFLFRCHFCCSLQACPPGSLMWPWGICRIRPSSAAGCGFTVDSDTVLLPHGCVFAGDSCPIQLYFLALQTQTQILLVSLTQLAVCGAGSGPHS